MYEVHVTEIGSFTECRRAWYLSRRIGFRSRGPQSALMIGAAVHEGLEHYYKNDRKHEDVLKAYDKSAGAEYDRLADEFAATWMGDLQISVSEDIDLGRAVLKNYIEYDQDQNQLEGEIVFVEQNWRYQLSESPDIWLSGKSDLGLRRFDGLWVVDHKTAKSKPNFSGLDVDDQLTAYCFLAWKHLDEIPRGALYNVLIKTVPGAPRTISKGKKLSQDKSQKTTYDLYLQSLKEMEFDPADYGDMLAYLADQGMTPYFAREWTLRNESELRAYERRTTAIALQMYEAEIFPERLTYAQPGTWKCGGCPFLQVCKNVDDGGDYEALLDSLFYIPVELTEEAVDANRDNQAEQ